MASQCLRCRSLLITRHGICLVCGWDESTEDSQEKLLKTTKETGKGEENMKHRTTNTKRKYTMNQHNKTYVHCQDTTEGNGKG